MESHEQGAREAADEMERDADEMEHHVEELGDDIDEAKKAAANRPEAGSDSIADVAGDWEDEASGANQGSDAAEGSENA